MASSEASTTVSAPRPNSERPYLSEEVVSVKRQKSEDRLAGLADVKPLVERLQTKNAVLDRTCRQCQSSNNNNKIYCYKCLVPVGKPEENALPRVDLPIKLDILRHPKELRTKSTALHAGILCPKEMVRIEELPNESKLSEIDPEKTLLLFPTADSTTLEEIPDLNTIERVVVVDSTWQQANSVLRSDLCQRLTRRVKLAKTHETSFWRHQRKGDDHLATIEAIYYFFRERYEVMNKGDYDGRYDNMLYIFVGMLRVIEEAKKHEKEEEETKAKDDESKGKEKESSS